MSKLQMGQIRCSVCSWQAILDQPVCEYGRSLPFGCSSLWQTPGLAHRHYKRLERPALEKNYSFKVPLVNYERKKFRTFTAGLTKKVVEIFMIVQETFSSSVQLVKKCFGIVDKVLLFLQSARLAKFVEYITLIEESIIK